MKIRIAIVGVTGYTGLELMKIVMRHPAMECAAVMASESTGERDLGDIHPQLRALSNLTCLPFDLDRLANLTPDTVFLCTPDEISHRIAPEILLRGSRVIDFSGSFRLRNATSYSSWYGFDHDAPEVLTQAVYGLPEWNSRSIAGARLVANPGCYPTSILLPLLPLVKAGFVEPGSEIFCDSKSGVTGAGRGARLELLFAEVSENFRPYSPIVHRHAPEVCQELGWDLGNFTFIPHLLPVNRGILTTLYLGFQQALSSEEIDAEFRRRYESHRFIRVLCAPRLPDLRGVNHSNFCDIGWRLTHGGKRAVIFSAIDNLIKGAAGQAVQNFNLMHGLEEGMALMEGESIAIHG